MNRNSSPVFGPVQVFDRLEAGPVTLKEKRLTAEMGTSTSLAVRPCLVQMDRAKAFVSNFSIQYLNFSTQGSLEWYARTAHLSKDGVLGDPPWAVLPKHCR
ncbi:MAG: hypothetical protein WAN36_04590 [Calditrichia bacterium]